MCYNIFCDPKILLSRFDVIITVYVYIHCTFTVAAMMYMSLLCVLRINLWLHKNLIFHREKVQFTVSNGGKIQCLLGISSKEVHKNTKRMVTCLH